MDSFKTWMEADAASFDKYDLLKKYQHFNNLLFDNQLPEIPISYANIRAGGVVQCTVVLDPNNLPNPRLVRFGLQSKYHGATIQPGTHRMKISNVFKRSEEGLDAILIHEMIHVYFNATGQFGERHGAKFVAMARTLSEKVGFTIPLTDDIPKMGLTDESKLKAVGVLLITKKDGSSAFALMTEKHMRTQLPEIITRWNELLRWTSYGVRAECYTITSIKWTEIAMHYPVQRKPAKTLAFYRVTNEMPISELRTMGELLADLRHVEK